MYEQILMFSNHVYKIIILSTLVIIKIPNLEIFLLCQHNSTGSGNLELRPTIDQNSTVLPRLYKCRFSGENFKIRQRSESTFALLA
jgi:hypothetical protein